MSPRSCPQKLNYFIETFNIFNKYNRILYIYIYIITPKTIINPRVSSLNLKKLYLYFFTSRLILYNKKK
jgi:hypothetical protein